MSVSQPYDINRQKHPTCFVISDIRGDFRLLYTLLVQIANVAKLTNKKWSWTATNTTVVVLGNFTDRFDAKGLNRLRMTTSQAIVDETRILDAFIQLEKQQKEQDNHFVVLMGDHELGNLLNWDSYVFYQMVNPAKEKDREERKLFVENSLKPFCEHHGVIAGWGQPGGEVYFSHGSLNKSWFTRLGFNSIQQVNQQWQQWLKSNSTLHIKHFGADDSPVMSCTQAIRPQSWRDSDEEFITHLLGPEPSPRFVQSTTIPVQRLLDETQDVRLRPISFDRNKLKTPPAMLVSRNFDAVEQFYFINNLMPDTYCIYDDVDRQPQVLKIELTLNNQSEALFVDVTPLVMSEVEYRVYLKELPFGSCGSSLPYTKIKLTEEEFVQIKPALKELGLTNSDKMDQIKKVGIFILSFDRSRLFMYQNSRNKWTVPMGDRHSNETDWEAMKRIMKEQINVDRPIPFDETNAKMIDYDVSTRLWIKPTVASLHADGKVYVQWIELKKITQYDVDQSVVNILKHVQLDKLMA